MTIRCILVERSPKITLDLFAVSLLTTVQKPNSTRAQKRILSFDQLNHYHFHL